MVAGRGTKHFSVRPIAVTSFELGRLKVSVMQMPNHARSVDSDN